MRHASLVLPPLMCTTIMLRSRALLIPGFGGGMVAWQRISADGQLRLKCRGARWNCCCSYRYLRAVGHRGGYLECAQHAEEIFGQEFDTSHCSVADEANAALTRAEHAYDHLALPVMELITKALEHDDWCARLKAILDPPEMVEVSDDEEPAGDDGEGGGNGADGGDDDGDSIDRPE
ncbi:hypothetical protein HanPSC8_Chr09g0388951 [Helianthus annuus]|nr:hypothetical protein HanPSC8_Chr09g0388951 [Helianthus annuus]